MLRTNIFDVVKGGLYIIKHANLTVRHSGLLEISNQPIKDIVINFMIAQNSFLSYY